jgi:transposase-like protein
MIDLPKPFPAEFRRDAVAVARKREVPVRQIAKDLGISESCLNRWLQQADVEDGVRPGATVAESAELLAVSKDHLQVGEQLTARLIEEITALGLRWQPVFNKGLRGLQTTWRLQVLIVDVYWNGPVRLAVAVPTELEQLGIDAPYPTLPSRCLKAEREYGGTIHTVEQMPDLKAAIALAKRFEPASEPMADTRSLDGYRGVGPNRCTDRAA